MTLIYNAIIPILAFSSANEDIDPTHQPSAQLALSTDIEVILV